MNNKSLVKLSNSIGIIAIILLLYWVFVFTSIQVFGLKVFRGNITETFYLSVVGILALMAGAVMINVMFNLTRIAEKHNEDSSAVKHISKSLVLLFVLSFPLVFGLLLGGDYITSMKKEKMLIQSAKSIIESNSENSSKLVNYTFDKNLTTLQYVCNAIFDTERQTLSDKLAHDLGRWTELAEHI